MATTVAPVAASVEAEALVITHYFDGMTCKGLVRLVVESVEARDRVVTRVVVVPAARPFFADDDLLLAPPDGLQGARSKVADPLAWYAMA